VKFRELLETSIVVEINCPSGSVHSAPGSLGFDRKAGRMYAFGVVRAIAPVMLWAD
jgi:hypothetical protein